MLHTGCLSSVVNESAIYEFLTEESMSTSSSPNETDKKSESIFKWLKRNCINKPRTWLADVLKRLNNWLESIKIKAQAAPGSEQTLWQKVKTKIASMILYVTKKLESYVRPSDGGAAIEKEMNEKFEEVGKQQKEINKLLKDSKEKNDKMIKELEDLINSKKQAKSISNLVNNKSGKEKDDKDNSLNARYKATNNETGKEEEVSLRKIIGDKNYTFDL